MSIFHRRCECGCDQPPYLPLFPIIHPKVGVFQTAYFYLICPSIWCTKKERDNIPLQIRGSWPKDVPPLVCPRDETNSLRLEHVWVYTGGVDLHVRCSDPACPHEEVLNLRGVLVGDYETIEPLIQGTEEEASEPILYITQMHR